MLCHCLGTGIHFLTLGFDVFIADVVIKGHELVEAAVRRNFNDAVGHSLVKLVVLRMQQQAPFVVLERVVECRDGLEVKVAGRLVEQKEVRMQRASSARSCSALFLHRKVHYTS